MASLNRISAKAAASFGAGILSLVCGFLAVASSSDLFLIGVPAFFVAAVILGMLGRRDIRRAPANLRGKALAAWGMAIPVGGIGLGFFLLPAV
jgi:hypothetical protein